jgi:hypothetical protein
MALGQKKRFTVFQRDNFTCVYCNRSTPEIVLQVDHVIPKSKGGTDDIVNLATSCFDCNSGKSNRDLSQVPISVQESLLREKERIKQIKLFRKYQLEVIKYQDDSIEKIGTYWFNQFLEKDKWLFGGARRQSIKIFLNKLPISKIFEAMDITFQRIGIPRTEYDEEQFRYFCGVVWNMVKKQKEGNNA